MLRRATSFAALVAACRGGHPTATTVDAQDTQSPSPSTSASSVITPTSAVESAAPPNAVVDNGDPSARGRADYAYALLVAGRLDDAATALEEARQIADTPVLHSQVEFNIGLLEEKRGNAEHARAAFARAYALHPSDAAKKKLAGKSTCAASIDRAPMIVGPGDGATTDYLVTSSWRDVRAFAASYGASLVPTIHDWTIKPTSESDARKLVCTDTSNPEAGTSLCAGAAPWAIDLGHMMFRESFVHVLPVGARMLVVFGGADGGGCTGMGARPAMATSVSGHGSVLEVDSAIEWWNEATCKTGKVIRTDHATTFYDVASLRITRIDAAATLAGRTLTIDAKSCDPVSLDP